MTWLGRATVRCNLRELWLKDSGRQCMHTVGVGDPLVWTVMKHETRAMQKTWHYLLNDMKNAIPSVQRRYWDILINEGLVV